MFFSASDVVRRIFIQSTQRIVGVRTQRPWRQLRYP